jgi:CRP/FNR family cyclic AMP-dependent transcriptional regulator
MANRLGCSREMVSRLMKDLEAGSYLRPTALGLCVVRPLPMRW